MSLNRPSQYNPEKFHGQSESFNNFRDFKRQFSRQNNQSETGASGVSVVNGLGDRTSRKKVLSMYLTRKVRNQCFYFESWASEDLSYCS
jgi:hypothetical protein